MIHTPWGYVILSGEEKLHDILTLEEFNVMTANRYKGDTRIESSIRAAQSVIRNYCGWHVYPKEQCRLRTFGGDKAIAGIAGNELLIQLPARTVESVVSVNIAGTDRHEHVMEADGILRVFDVGSVDRKTEIQVEYIAGVLEGFADSIKELVMQRVSHAMAQSYGIQSETTGSVQVTYNASWVNGAQATRLQDFDKEILEPYRLQGVF